MTPLAIAGAGAITSVGLTAPATCAAIRSAIDNFTDVDFMDRSGEWVLGSVVPLDPPARGLDRLVALAASAIRECLAEAPLLETSDVPLLLCVAEPARPGRIEGLDERLLPAVERALETRFHESSRVLAMGRVGGAAALELAASLLREANAPGCVIAGVDSFLGGATLGVYETQRRLLTSTHSNGFIPGEGAAAVLVVPAEQARGPALLCLGIGKGTEPATIAGEEPLRADGLVVAIQAALADAGVALGDLDYRITDSNGEQYWFREAALALHRILRGREELFEIWHPADCVGETGAAIGPLALVVARRAALMGYAFGRGPLCHFSADGPERYAVVLGYRPEART